MNTLMHSEIFFFISSIGFVICFIVLFIAGIYLISIFRKVSRITTKIEQDVATIGDTAKEFVTDIQESTVFSLLFRKKKKYNK